MSAVDVNGLAVVFAYAALFALAIAGMGAAWWWWERHPPD